MYKFDYLQEAAEHVYQLQLQTRKDRTFAVSGLLLDCKGRVIYAGSNRVLVKIDKAGGEFVIDPTSHCEQRMIYWYFANREKLALPAPHQLTILTSLDPCVMCASTILLSGFNVGTITLDTFAGINYNHNCFEDYHFAPKLQHQLIDTFGYYRVKDVDQRKEYRFQAQKVHFKEQEITQHLERKMAAQFEDTVFEYGGIVKSRVDKFKDLKELANNDQLVRDLKQLSPEALSVVLKQTVCAGSSCYRPSKVLKDLLLKMVQTTPGVKNAVAVVDPFGNLLITRADRFDLSPVHTALVNSVKDYSLFRFQQFEKASNEGKFELVASFLPPLSRCSFIFLNALAGDDAVSLQAVGILNFTHYDQLPKGAFQYINDYPKGTLSLEEAVTHLAPMYTSKHNNMIPMLAELSD